MVQRLRERGRRLAVAERAVAVQGELTIAIQPSKRPGGLPRRAANLTMFEGLSQPHRLIWQPLFEPRVISFEREVLMLSGIELNIGETSDEIFETYTMSSLPSSLASLPSVATAPLPAAYQRACQALVACSSIDECQDWADKAQAMASYARQSKDETLRKMADRIQARAIRRCGELLKLVPSATGAHLKQDATVPFSREQVAADAGLSERQRKTALRVAAVPDRNFND